MTSSIDGAYTFAPILDSQKSIKMTFDSQIIENYAPGKVLNGESFKTLASVQDEHGNPVTFILKSNNKISVIWKNFGTEDATGYKEIKLTENNLNSIINFGIDQNVETGNYTIAITELDVNNPKKINIYVTKPLSNESEKMFTTLSIQKSDFWSNRGAIYFEKPNSNITQVLAGSIPLNGKKSPGVVVATSEDNQAYYYLIDSDLSQPTIENPKRIHVGDQSEKVIDFAVGKRQKRHGIFMLQEKANNAFLRFHSFPRRGSDRNISTTLHTFKNHENPKSIQILAEEDDKSGVYMAGNGLYYLSAKAQEKEYEIKSELPLEVLISSEKACGLQKMTLREDQDSITLWALNDQEEMLTTEQKKTAVSGYTTALQSEEWPEPMIIARNVMGWAAIRNQIKKTNDLMVLMADDKLTHLIQDRKTTNFRHTDIPLDDSDFLQKYPSYSTQLTFQDQDGFPYNNNLKDEDKGFEFSSSEWCEVSVNGKAYELEPDKITFIKTDLQGIITLVHKADSISPSIFKVKLNGANRIVNPAQKVDEKLDSLTSPEVLRKEEWIDEAGKKHKLISPEISDEKLKGTIEGIKNFNTIRKDLPVDGSIDANYLKGVNLAAQNRPEIWGMRISSDGKVSYFEEEGVYSNMLDSGEVSWWDDALLRAAGNVLEWMKGVVRDFVEIVVKVVKGAWRIAVKIGETAYSFVVECLGHLYNGINWLLDKVLGIDLDKIRKWIGYVFNMTEVRQAHQLISHITKQLPGYAKAKAEGLKSEVNGFFDKLIKDVKTLKEIDHDFAKSSFSDSKTRILDNEMKESHKNGMENVIKSPAGNFVNYHVGHQSQKNAPSLETLFQHGEIQLFLHENQSIIDKIVKELEGIEGTIKKMAQDFLKIVNGKMTLNQAITTITGNALILFLESAKVVTNLIFELFKALIDLLGMIITQPINIPFLTALVRLILADPNRELSGSDHLLLPLCMPVVMLYKIIFPSNSDKPMFDSEGMAKIMSLKGEALIEYLFKPVTSSNENPVVTVLKILQPFIGAFTSFASNIASLVNALGVEGTVFTTIQGALTVINLFVGVPIDNYTIPSIIKSIVNLLQIFVNAVPGVLGGAIGCFGDIVNWILSMIDLIEEMFKNPKKPAILIWGGINESISVFNSVLILATGIAKTPKIQIPLAIGSSVSISAEFISGLSHAILDATTPELS